MIYKYSKIHGGSNRPTKIIIHAMSEFIAGLPADEYLENIAKLSVHYLIQTNGDVMKCVDPCHVAYHALKNNSQTIGIEVLVKGDLTYIEFLKRIKDDWVINKQMISLIQLCNNLIKLYNIKEVVRHSDVDPGRKFDPGAGFDWDFFIENLEL